MDQLNEAQSEILRLRTQLHEAETNRKEAARKVSVAATAARRYKAELEAQTANKPRQMQESKLLQITGAKDMDSLMRVLESVDPKLLQDALTGSLKEELDAYRDLGTPQEIKDGMTASEDVIKDYKELGSPDEISEAFDDSEKLVASLKKTGVKIADIPKVIKEGQEAQKNLRLKKIKETAMKLSRQFGVEVKAVLEMLRHMPEQSVLKTLTEMKGETYTPPKPKRRPTSEDGEETPVDPPEGEEEEGQDEEEEESPEEETPPAPKAESRASRLMKGSWRLS